MGKLGRFACIFVPMALTIASLICLILVFSGQTNKDMALQRDLYFFKADTSGFTSNPETFADHISDLPGNLDENIDNELLDALQQSAQTSNELKDVYYIGLWNYCEGDKNDKNETKITHCSSRKANFWFNPIEAWGLQNTSVQEAFPDELQKGLDTYKTVSKWMFTAYVIAICLTAAEFVVGIFAIFSRWGSFVTTIVSTAQTVFIIAAAATSTALYASLVGVFESVLKPYNIEADLGSKMLSVLWLGVAFSIGSGFFWLISTCCCSGKSGNKKVVVEKTPYTYERVSSPYMGNSGNSQMPATHGNTGTGYEPFRHERV
ncbi:integral membrane protein [Corynespora cassiicola Philippines]|uniref:Integral membrane protein n=1 Tax=Corynespora cassiicola Philippines TaxID=1448308 RepID=A0A2T2NXV0_CORCC|nr:integral membrane protein [Corynespora cassiicola Philippines]